jgi:hypothetical protein
LTIKLERKENNKNKYRKEKRREGGEDGERR